MFGFFGACQCFDAFESLHPLRESLLPLRNRGDILHPLRETECWLAGSLAGWLADSLSLSLAGWLADWLAGWQIAYIYCDFCNLESKQLHNSLYLL